MRRCIKILSALLLLLSTEIVGQSGLIKVEIKGIEEHIGNISIGLFNDSSSFPKEGLDGIKIAADSDSISHIFSNLRKGEYAIAVYHDENNNDKLDRNFLGIPTEKYMFSNYAGHMFGPPNFDEAKFLLKDSVEIKLDFRK